MARTYERYLDAITAQASAAITADTISGGTKTAINKASSGNADGALWFEVYLDVTVAPSVDASAEIYIEPSYDGGSNYGAEDYALPCAVKASGASKYKVGNLYDTSENFYAVVYAIDYGFTASLILVPVYQADA